MKNIGIAMAVATRADGATAATSSPIANSERHAEQERDGVAERVDAAAARRTPRGRR